MNNNKDKLKKIIEDQQRIRVREKYTEAVKLREATIEANTNTSLKKRFRQL